MSEVYIKKIKEKTKGGKLTKDKFNLAYHFEDDLTDEEMSEIILHDFAHKVLMLFIENPTMINSNGTGCWIYNAFERMKTNDTYIRDIEPALSVRESEGLVGFIHDYIEDYMEHNYIGRGVKTPTIEQIYNFCGGCEFPFIEAYIVHQNAGRKALVYYITR